MPSARILRRVALVRTDVSEEHGATIIRVTRIGELEATLAMTSNRRTPRRHVGFFEVCVGCVGLFHVGYVVNKVPLGHVFSEFFGLLSRPFLSSSVIWGWYSWPRGLLTKCIVSHHPKKQERKVQFEQQCNDIGKIVFYRVSHFTASVSAFPCLFSLLILCYHFLP
jgi:hypothetical protein